MNSAYIQDDCPLHQIACHYRTQQCRVVIFNVLRCGSGNSILKLWTNTDRFCPESTLTSALTLCVSLMCLLRMRGRHTCALPGIFRHRFCCWGRLSWRPSMEKVSMINSTSTWYSPGLLKMIVRPSADRLTISSDEAIILNGTKFVGLSGSKREVQSHLVLNMVTY